MGDITLNPDTWIDAYGNYLYNFAIMRVYNSEVAEDLVQDTFYSAVKAKESFLGNSSEKTWLTSILKRKIIDYYRKNSRNKEDNILDNPDHFQKEGILKGHWEDNSLPEDWQYPENQILENTEFYKVVKKCLSKIPSKIAATFTLKEFEDYSTEEICKELNITPSNLWVMIHRTKVQLRDCIEKSWFKPDEKRYI